MRWAPITAGRQYRRLAGFMKQFAKSNTGAVTMQSGLGVPLNFSDADLAAMAADAGLDAVPVVNPVTLPFAGDVPVYRNSSGLTLDNHPGGPQHQPGCCGAMLSAQARLLPEMAGSD